MGRGILLVAAAGCLSAAAVRFDVDYSKSAIAVRTDKTGIFSAFAGHRHGILAGEFSARVCADAGTLENASVAVRVPASSLRIDTPEARRAAGVTGSGPSAKDVAVIQQKMLSPANLDAPAHSEIHFESSSVSGAADRLTVSGPLTIRGRARVVSAPLRIERAGSDYRFTGSFNIKLSDYGIEPESVGGVVKVADRVSVLLDLVTRPTNEPCR